MIPPSVRILILDRSKSAETPINVLQNYDIVLSQGTGHYNVIKNDWGDSINATVHFADLDRILGMFGVRSVT